MPLTPTRTALANGATVIVQENHATPAVSILAAVNAGGYQDPPGREGTAALLARTLDRGTVSRTADAIADDLDARGAGLSVTASRHQVAVSATCLVEDFSPVLRIVADVLRAPVFPEADVATRRTELITTIRQDDDDPALVALNRLAADLYGPHPYGRRTRGSVSTVAALTRADLVAYHERHIVPGALTLVIVGGLAADAMLAAAGEVLAPWPGAGRMPAPAVPDPVPPVERRETRVRMPDKSQSDVAYGFVGIRRADPDFAAATVMNNALGQYALGGRLGDSIRERQGMAYYVFSTLDAGLGPGPVLVRAGVATQNVDRTIASIDGEIAAVRAEGFTDKEVAESKQYLVGALPRQLETNAGIAAFLLSAHVFDLGLDYDRRFGDLIRGVTRDAAIAVARRLLDPGRATIAVAGPDGARP